MKSCGWALRSPRKGGASSVPCPYGKTSIWGPLRARTEAVPPRYGNGYSTSSPASRNGKGSLPEPSPALLLDEPSLGLAPLLVRSIFDSVRKINRQGVTVILVEQNARAALKLASRGYVIEVGRVVMEDASEALLANPDVQAAYLGGGQENGQEN